MADTTDNIFEDGENLQAAIGKALQENKALLCFVSDDSDETTSWEVALLDLRIRDRLRSSSVLLRLKAGSEQAGFLGSVCPIQSTPAIVIIHNAQVVANYQNRQTTFQTLQEQLIARYGSSTEVQQSVSTSATGTKAYFDLPPSEGRMRLPNNAYDQFRKLTQQYVSAGVAGKSLLHIQLMLLESLQIDVITKAVQEIQGTFESVTEPQLPEEAIERLLNTPAARLQAGPTPVNQAPASFLNSASSSRQANSAARSPDAAQSTIASIPAPSSPQSPPPETETIPLRTSQSETTARSPAINARTNNAASPSLPSSSSSSSSTPHTSQLSSYVTTQKARESAQNAERAQIKAQIAADKQARRDSEAAAAAEQRRIDLANLRKANSTTADPKASDIRIQVRLFDGSTIRNSFPAEATVGKEVRGWIDGEIAKKAAAASGGGQQQPYNLKLILAPLPTRTIEAGEEDMALCDLEGVKGSATMVVVPVRGFVDSYSGVGSSAGAIVGGATSVVGTGIGLVGSAAGMVMGGLGRLFGAGAGNAQPAQPQSQVPAREAESAPGGPSNAARSNVRVRTLADQRVDEEADRRKRGTDLYNGMGLNVQPRKDDNNKED